MKSSRTRPAGARPGRSFKLPHLTHQAPEAPTRRAWFKSPMIVSALQRFPLLPISLPDAWRPCAAQGVLWLTGGTAFSGGLFRNSVQYLYVDAVRHGRGHVRGAVLDRTSAPTIVMIVTAGVLGVQKEPLSLEELLSETMTKALAAILVLWLHHGRVMVSNGALPHLCMCERCEGRSRPGRPEGRDSPGHAGKSGNGRRWTHRWTSFVQRCGV